ncbi:hypothetical protein RDI86_02245 [Cellulosimicrobium sp. XJ-DQ-B-000]|uniref:phage capsid protein n=1 Tax=Cellulosimicrobium sp. XJ-DQ-B-000 TaxID=3072182 RepID=UPI002807B7E5|nr:hypothetical protein [Cellulosimicrobium sp. XJ-DQ-B-000]MDQ8040662.1 hypothetical protein [Cellulosimicrobium sp. XJ-DQ-B-000]
MAITNFVPELWSAAVQVPYEKALVFGQAQVANRDYEGQIRQQGDTIHVTTIDDPTVRDYDKNTDITVEDLNDGRISLVVDQGKYFAFRVNDVDKVQAAGNFESPAIARAGIGLRDAADKFIAAKFTENVSTGGPIAANRLGAVTVFDGKPESAGPGQLTAYQVLVKLREKLDAQSVPLEGRYVVVSPAFVSALLMDSRYTDLSASGSSDALLNGQVGRSTGFQVLVSGNLPTSGSATTICAGVPGALTYADQILETEALRDPNRFADIVRGLNVFGATIFRREGVATAQVTIATSSGS